MKVSLDKRLVIYLGVDTSGKMHISGRDISKLLPMYWTKFLIMTNEHTDSGRFLDFKYTPIHRAGLRSSCRDECPLLGALKLSSLCHCMCEKGGQAGCCWRQVFGRRWYAWLQQSEPTTQPEPRVFNDEDDDDRVLPSYITPRSRTALNTAMWSVYFQAYLRSPALFVVLDVFFLVSMFVRLSSKNIYQ